MGQTGYVFFNPPKFNPKIAYFGQTSKTAPSCVPLFGDSIWGFNLGIQIYQVQFTTLHKSPKLDIGPPKQLTLCYDVFSLQRRHSHESFPQIKSATQVRAASSVRYVQ